MDQIRGLNRKVQGSFAYFAFSGTHISFYQKLIDRFRGKSFLNFRTFRAKSFFMKMSDLDDLKGRILRKHPWKSRFYPPDLVQKCNWIYPNAPHTHVRASFYWWMIVLHAITIPSWKWVIYIISKGVFCKNTPKNHDFTPGFD